VATSEQKARTTPFTQTRERKATTARRPGCSRATMQRILRLDVAPYQQIVQQVRHALRLGVLVIGDQLPTLKEASTSLAINPNTVLKAYKLSSSQLRSLSAALRTGGYDVSTRESPNLD
jgi:regulatory GntR family protein